MDLYSDAPICNVEGCLKKDSIFCMSDLHNITPNNIHCGVFINNIIENQKYIFNGMQPND